MSFRKLWMTGLTVSLAVLTVQAKTPKYAPTVPLTPAQTALVQKAITQEKATVKAGQKIKLKINYKVTDKTGMDTQFIWIYSNDPSRPTQNFTIKANIVAQ